MEIEGGEVHPAMAAFGLWREEADLAGLADEIRANRDRQPRRTVPRSRGSWIATTL